MYYYDNPFTAIKEFSHVLKKNGKLVLILPFIYPIHDVPYDKYRFTEYGLRELLKNHFYVKEITTIGGIFNLPAVFFHSLKKGIPLMLPKGLGKFLGFIVTIIILPFYLIAQLVSLLDFLDKSGRWPTYYFVYALKR